MLKSRELRNRLPYSFVFGLVCASNRQTHNTHFRRNQNQATPLLGKTEIWTVETSEIYGISSATEVADEVLKYRHPPQSRYVLHGHEVWQSFIYEARELRQEIPVLLRTCVRPPSVTRKGLTRRTASEQPERALVLPQGLKVLAGDSTDVPLDEFGTNVPLERVGARRIQVDPRRHLHTGLLQTKRQPTCTAKQVNG